MSSDNFKTRFAAALTLAALASLAAAAGPALAQAPAGTPKLVIGDTTFNGGDVARGDKITHDFVVRNEGTADLLILSVRPGCGCTAPHFDKVVPAGGSGKIQLAVDTSAFKGPISKSATVTTNDPDQSTLRLVMNGTVKTFVDVLPRDTVTFRHYRGETRREELTIRSNEDGPFKIVDVRTVGDGIKHEVVPPSETERDWRVAVWIDPAAQVGSVNGSLRLLTNSAKEPEVSVTVRGTVLGHLAVNPSALYFRVDTASHELMTISGNVNLRERGEMGAPVVARLGKDERLVPLQQGDEWTHVRTSAGATGWVFNKLVAAAPSEAASEQAKILNVAHRQQGQFEIVGTEVQGANLSPNVVKLASESVRDRQAYRVTVTYAGGLASGNYSGFVVLKTSDKEEPEIRVPLYIVVEG